MPKCRFEDTICTGYFFTKWMCQSCASDRKRMGEHGYQGCNLFQMYVEYEAAMKRVANYFRMKYHQLLDEVEITDTPGYWRQKKVCGGIGKCKHPQHSISGITGSIRHTLPYFDSRRDDDRGRYTSPTRTWKIISDLEKILKEENME